MQRPLRFYGQLLFTILVCAFLIVPVVMSMMAGVTANFIRGISSGVTLRWIVEVWALYHDTIFLSLLIALACLICTILLGVPAAYVLSKRQGPVARMIEELLTLPLAIPGLAIALALIISFGGFRRVQIKLGIYSGWPCFVHLALYDALGTRRTVYR